MSVALGKAPFNDEAQARWARRVQAAINNIQATAGQAARTQTLVTQGPSLADVPTLPADTPSVPQNFTATGAYSTILLTWTAPSYTGHAVTEVYRSETDNFSQSVKIFETTLSIWSDAPGPGHTYYYWIRFRNVNNVQGPLNATAGTRGDTALDLDVLFEQIYDKTLETYLESYLSDTSYLIDTITTAITEQDALLAQISGATDLNGDGIVDIDERLVYLQQNVNTNKTETDAGLLSVTNGVLQNAGEMGSLTDDYSLVLGQVLALENVINDPETGFPATRALLLNEYYTKTTTDSAIATSTNTLKAQIFDEGDVISEAFYNSMATALVTENNALSQKIDQHTASLGDYIDADGNSVGSVSATYESLTQAIVNNTDGIISQHIDNYEIDVDGETASLQNWASVSYDTAGKFESQWGVKSQVGDLSNGIGLYNDGENSMFAMVANQIVTVNPITNEISQLFSIIQDDEVIPNGVYIDTAFIKAATIRDLVAGDVNADTVTAGLKIEAPEIEGGLFTGGSMSLTAGSYTLATQPGTTFPFWYGATADENARSVNNTLLGVSNDGRVYARGLTIRNLDGAVMMDVDGLNGTFIDDLSVNTLKVADNAISAQSYSLTSTLSLERYETGTSYSSIHSHDGATVAGSLLVWVIFQVTRQSGGGNPDWVELTAVVQDASDDAALESQSVQVGHAEDANQTYFVPLQLFVAGATAENIRVKFTARSGGETFSIITRVIVNSAKR